MKTETFIKWLTAELCAVAGLLWGDLDGMMIALICAMCLDMLTGLIAGAMQKRLESAVCFRGVCKKLLILLVVALGHILDTYVFGSAFCKAVAEGFYIANEGLSILENAGKFIPYPKKLRDVLKQLKSENDDEQEGKNDDNS